MKTFHRQKQIEFKEYIVERIVGKKYDPITNEVQYCIKWEGYDDRDNTWEPIKHLKNVMSLIDEFESRLHHKKKPKIDSLKLKQLLEVKLAQFLSKYAPKEEQKEICLSDFDSSSEEVPVKQQEGTQKNLDPSTEPKSHILIQGFHWCPQNYESNIEY